MPPRGYQQHGYMPPQGMQVPVYGGMMQGAQGSARGARRGPAPRQQQHMQHQRNYVPTQQARNMQQMPPAMNVPPPQPQEGERTALTAAALAAASLADQKNMIGERL